MTKFGTPVFTNAGDSLPVTQVYEDGSYLCPYCNYPVMPTALACENPGCYANPSMTAEFITKRRAETLEAEQAAAQRRSWREIAYRTK